MPLVLDTPIQSHQNSELEHKAGRGISAVTCISLNPQNQKGEPDLHTQRRPFWWSVGTSQNPRSEKWKRRAVCFTGGSATHQEQLELRVECLVSRLNKCIRDKARINDNKRTFYHQKANTGPIFVVLYGFYMGHGTQEWTRRQLMIKKPWSLELVHLFSTIVSR